MKAKSDIHLEAHKNTRAAAVAPPPTAPVEAEIDWGHLALADIIDVPALQALLENFGRLTGMMGVIVDSRGELLMSASQPDICAQFHRCHPLTSQYCRESDSVLAQASASGSYQSYRCKNGLWDMSVPIVVAGRHLGNISFGQFIYADEDLNREHFRNLALRYGFDEQAYLAALDQVPRYDRQTVAEVMDFYSKLGAMIAALSFSNLSLSRTLTQQQRAEAELRESEKSFELLFTNAPLGYQSLDFAGYFIDVNNKWLEILGYSRDEVIGKWFGDFLCPEYLEEFRTHFPLFQSQGSIHCEFEMRSKSGKPLLISFDGKIAYDSDGSFKQTHCILQDITERIEMEHQLFNEKELFKTTLISIGDGVISTDTQGQVLIMNKVAEQLTGWTMAEALGQPIDTVFYIIDVVTRTRTRSPVARVLDTARDSELVNQTLLISKAGLERSIEDSAAPVIDAQGNLTGVVLVFRDFTDRRKHQEAIKYLSFHDHLTGLYNRRFYEEELSRLDIPRNWPLSIVMGDVNGLKLINDSFGHITGDLLLIKTATALTDSCRADDIIARMGGDEFVLLLPKTDAVEAEQLIKRIKKSLKKEKIEGLEISVSFGADTKTTAADKIEEVFKKAEDIMYHNKLFEGPSIKARVINNIVAVINHKSYREEVHSKRVSELCEKMGVALALEDNRIKELKAFGLLHDIGKIAIADELLLKPGPLSEAEWVDVKNHAEIGYRILSTNKDMAEIAEYVLAHHEHWDGSGYPKGLKGLEIPLPSRICAIADAYEAMTGECSYKAMLSPETAISELRNQAGSQFDPELVALFCDLEL